MLIFFALFFAKVVCLLNSVQYIKLKILKEYSDLQSYQHRHFILKSVSIVVVCWGRLHQWEDGLLWIQI